MDFTCTVGHEAGSPTMRRVTRHTYKPIGVLKVGAAPHVEDFAAMHGFAIKRVSSGALPALLYLMHCTGPRPSPEFGEHFLADRGWVETQLDYQNI